jgi:membrane-associated phospholipid phosphatase
VHRTRPDGSDRKSFWSEHTALAAANGGWSVGIGYTVAIAVGDLRGAANVHHPSDIGVGFGVGLLARKVCP